MTSLLPAKDSAFKSLGERRDVIPLCFVLGVYLLLVFLGFNQIEEDTFIYLRVAENIADGHGYVFNRGYETIEVGSSNLWLLLLVVMAKLPLDMIWSAKLLGITCGAGVLVMTYALSRRLSNDPVIPTFAALATAASAPFLFWSHRGLETPLHTLLLVSLVYMTVDRSRFKYAPVILALMLFGRPETPLLILGIVPALLIHRISIRQMLLPGAALLGVALTQELVRYLYFGDLLPQPFYLKMGRSGANGIQLVGEYFRLSHIGLVALPVVVSICRRSFWSAQVVIVASYACMALAWPCLAFDGKPFFRFVAPAVPLVWILLAHGFQHIAPSKTPQLRRVVYAYLCLVWLYAAFLPNLNTGSWRGDPWPMTEALRTFGADPIAFTRATLEKIRRPFEPNSTDELFFESIGSNYEWQVGEFLANNYAEGTTVIYDQMGQTPYRAGHDKTFVDSFGLTDKRTGYNNFLRQRNNGPLMRAYHQVFRLAIANRAGKNLIFPRRKDILNELMGLESDLIVLNAVIVSDAPGSTTAALASDPRLTRDYLHTFTLFQIVDVYERKGLKRIADPVEVPHGLSVVDIQNSRKGG